MLAGAALTKYQAIYLLVPAGLAIAVAAVRDALARRAGRVAGAGGTGRPRARLRSSPPRRTGWRTSCGTATPSIRMLRHLLPLAADGAGVARDDARSRVRADRDDGRKAPRDRRRGLHVLVRPARLADLSPRPSRSSAFSSRSRCPILLLAPGARRARALAAATLLGRLHLVLDLSPGSVPPGAAPLDGRLHGGRAGGSPGPRASARGSASSCWSRCSSPGATTSPGSRRTP